MKSGYNCLLFAMTLSLFVSCGGGDGDGGGGTEREESTTGGPTTGGTTTGGTTTGGTTGGTSGYDVTLDSELTSNERASADSSIQVLNSLQIDGSDIPGFTESFGGNRTSNVISYLERRVNYIFSEHTDILNTRLVRNSNSRIRAMETFASNPSVIVWYIDILEESGVKLSINNNFVDVNSSRIGAMNIGEIFVQSDAITRAITLVHEARHSDCPEGALASEILRTMEGFPPFDPSCGQLHNACNGACDSIPWGAYTMDFIYSAAIVLSCTSCTETEKQQAQVNANQVQNQAFDLVNTLNGTYGPPNMGNSTQVRDDL